MSDQEQVVKTWQLPGGTLALADCLEWLSLLPHRSIRLIAIDPPFATGKARTGRLGLASSSAFDIPSEDLTPSESSQSQVGQAPPAYADRWEGVDQYVAWLMDRVSLMRELLLPDGSFLIHLDWHAVHAVKVALDRLFGEKNFQNEIIWFYQTGGASQNRFSRKHDTLLWYTRSNQWVFHPERIRVHRSPKALERARNPKGARITVEDDEKLPGDVLFVPPLNPMARERNGYPTQKPLELMELFVEALTEPGECVADFFCGSGTTVVAAGRLGRRWLACDRSRHAVELTRARLEDLGGLFSEFAVTKGDASVSRRR